MNTKELLVRAVREGANVTMFLEALTEVRPATPKEKAVIAAAREYAELNLMENANIEHWLSQGKEMERLLRIHDYLQERAERAA